MVVAVAESSCDVLSLRPLQVLSIGYILDIRFVPLSSTCNRDKSLLEVCGRRIFYIPNTLQCIEQDAGILLVDLR